jgi:hypothetical protein
MRRPAAFLLFVIFGAITWVACSSSDNIAPTAPSFVPNGSTGTEKCEDFGSWEDKDEVGPPWSITADPGDVIDVVCLKAGTKVYIATSDGTISVNGTPCFDISGIGTGTVTATNNAGHVGNICKGISHIEVRFEPAPSPSPSPSPEPSPSPSPSPDPSPSPSPSPD